MSDVAFQCEGVCVTAAALVAVAVIILGPASSFAAPSFAAASG